MSKTSLFDSAPTKSKNLVEFKAGKMNIDEKNWVHADKRKGLVYIHRGPDGLIHFCWKDRTSGEVEDDLIVFPDDTEFKKIPQCTTGRVYVLKFKDSKKLFLWLQEPKIDKDEEICKNVNDNLNSPPSQGGANIRSHIDSDMQELLTGLGGAGYSISQNDIMSLLGIDNSGLRSDSEVSSRVSSANPSSKAKKPIEPKAQPKPEVTPIAESSSSNDGSVKIKINDLRSVLSNIQSTYGEKPVHIDLTDAISSEAILPLLEKPDNVARLQPLLPHCEDGSITQHIKDNVQSPQMHSAVQTFGSALQSGDLAPVIAHFGLGEPVNEASKTGNLKSFAQAMESNLHAKNNKDEQHESMPVDEASQGDEPMEQD